MVPDGAQRFCSSFKAVDHSCTLEGRNDERRSLLGVHSGADFSRFDPRTDYRNDVAPPATQRLACALTQNRISVIGIDRRVEQWTATGNRSPPLNKIRNQLLEPVDGIGDGIQVVNPRVQGFLPGIVKSLGRQRLLAREVPVDSAFFEARRAHEVREDRPVIPSLIEDGRRFTNDLLSGSFAFAHFGPPHASPATNWPLVPL
jgi:hypothetical protein